jgi:uncharacterized membrane protein YbhN (UPF0104 family)
MMSPAEVDAAADPRVAPSSAPASSKLWLALRIGVPLALLAYLFMGVSKRELLHALASVPISLALGVYAIELGNWFISAVRWRIVLRACGVRGRAPLLSLFRLHWVGGFYNNCLPGGVGGDAVRAMATRSLFGERGLPAALAISFLERLLGLCGLLILVTVTFALFPLPGVPNVMMWSGLGFLAVAGCVGAIVLAPRLAPWMPGPLKKLLLAVPVIESFSLFGVGVLLSVVTQLVGVLKGYLVLSNVTSSVTLAQALVVMPLILASQYFPLSVGGAGVREVAFVGLFGLVGVPRHDSLAASLVITALLFASSATGGVVQMLRPLALDSAGPERG